MSSGRSVILQVDEEGNGYRRLLTTDMVRATGAFIQDKDVIGEITGRYNEDEPVDDYDDYSVGEEAEEDGGGDSRICVVIG